MAIECFNLYEHHITWVKTQPRGSRSKMIRRCIDFYIRHGQVMDSRDILQNLVLEQSDQITALERVRQVGGWRLLLAFLCGYILPHTLNLLEHALFG